VKRGICERGGWYVPAFDTYFSAFLGDEMVGRNKPPRINPFQRSHLLAAFEYVKDFTCAIDIGAHVGFWTVDLAQRFNLVFAIEPNPTNFACLVKNTSNLDNVFHFNAALGEKVGSVNSISDLKRQGNSGSYHVRVIEEGEIPMFFLDGLELPRIGLLKIDVEGFEPYVLRGAEKTIERERPVIHMEADKFFKGRYDEPEGAAERWLLDHDYEEVWHERPNKIFVPRG